MLRVRDWLKNKHEGKHFEPIDFLFGDIIEARRLSDGVHFQSGDEVIYFDKNLDEPSDLMEIIGFYDDNIHVDIEGSLYVMKIDINLLKKQ